MAGTDAADAMAQVDAVVALGAADRPVVHGKGDCIAPAERHDFDAALHARALLGQHELAAGEILLGYREQNSHLNREGEIAVEILMQAVEVAGPVLQQQRRRAGLAGGVTNLEILRVPRRIARGEIHPRVPRVGNSRQMRIERRAQLADEIWQRILEIAVFPLAETVARHMNLSAEM